MSKKTAYLGMLCGAAIILGYVEMLFPVFGPVAGIKVGLPNLAIVAVLFLYGWKEALALSIVRILVIGFLFGNAFSIAFSLAGGLFSLLCMQIAGKYLKLSCAGVSMIGGVTHNAGQILVAMVLVENVRVGYYFSILAVTGLVTGILIGIGSSEIIKRIRKAVPELRQNF